MSIRLRVDPTACTAHGLCAHLLAERVRLDEWGYPIVDDRPLEPALQAPARLAARERPTRALRLTRVT
jgi:ferredoxin